MLSARGAELDRVRGLELGADDYVTKPFSLMELLARVASVLRRAQGEATEPTGLVFGEHRVGEGRRDTVEVGVAPSAGSAAGRARWARAAAARRAADRRCTPRAAREQNRRGAGTRASPTGWSES